MSIPASSKEIIKQGVVTIISKTYCPYCDRTKSLLKQMNVKFQAFEVDFLEWPDNLVEEFHSLAKMRTYPKTFIGEVCVGGHSELTTASKNGDLFKLLDAQSIAYQKPSF